MSKITRTFKSGNSVAVRLPAALGVKPGTEMRVREEQGRYLVEPVQSGPRRKIDLSALYGPTSDLSSISRDGDESEDIVREWHLLGLEPR
jgi:antitoxin VapB